MTSTVNHDNSQNDVLTTPTHVLYHFEQLVRKEMPNCRVVYDPELDYESVLRAAVNDDNFNDEGGPLVPVLGYNRTQLIPSELAGPGRRMRNITGTIRSGDNAVQYSASHSEFDIQFVYLTTSAEQSDKFEVVYESDEGISGSKKLSVDMGELGVFDYFLTYDDLISREIILNEQYYKAIMGSVKVRGYYFTFRSSSGIIKEIVAKIWASRNPDLQLEDELLGQSTITE